MFMLTPTQPSWSKPRSISFSDASPRQHDLGTDPVGIATRKPGICVVQPIDRSHALRPIRRGQAAIGDHDRHTWEAAMRAKELSAEFGIAGVLDFRETESGLVKTAI